VSGGGPTAAVDEGAAAEPLPEELAGCTTLTGAEAIDCFSAYTEANPQDPDGWTQFGLFAIQSGISGGGSAQLFEAGETFIGRALEIDPGDVEARVYLAVLLERTGRVDEAATELARLDGVDIPAALTPLVELVERGVAAG
nr:tetratricopeptide repeat protein [Acidimicrobiia bacterium]